MGIELVYRPTRVIDTIKYCGLSIIRSPEGNAESGPPSEPAASRFGPGTFRVL
jgi:hypothetical protein